MENRKIICVGEILWDSMPAGLFLGGAPYNVAHDLHQLGNDANLASRVGSDFLGDEVLLRMRRKGMSTDLIQVDEKFSTGFVRVLFDENGTPDYQILAPVAWDYIEADQKFMEVVSESAALVFGTLASRAEASRRTIRSLIDASHFRVLDVNLRPGALSKEIVEGLLSFADLVKLNSSELQTLRSWFNLPAADKDAAEELATRFSNRMVSISYGELGGSLWHDGHWTHHPGFKVEVQNSVGAGDAFLAGLLSSMIHGKSDEEMIETANLLGAYVVTKHDAGPDFHVDEMNAVRSNIGN